MILHGRNLIIKADGVAIAASKSCTVNIDAEIIKVSSPDDGEWEHSITGLKSWDVQTSHLVTDIISGRDMVGTKVQLDIQAFDAGSGIYPVFDGFVYDVSVEMETAPSIGRIMYDTYNYDFVMQVGSIYYGIWEGKSQYYTTRANGDIFRKKDNGILYRMQDYNLTAMAMQGYANVKSWHGTFTVGNLAQGSFSFKGTGPLE